MNRLVSKYGKASLTLLFGVMVFLFWGLRYPFALNYQEQLQLFLFDGDYFMSRMAEPGGLARYVGEFLVQFYNRMTVGAMLIALLFMLLQRVTWRLMRSESHYAWSFLPAVLLWYAMGDENLLLTYVVALLFTLLFTWVVARIFIRWGYEHKMLMRKLWVMLVLVPLMYWLVGPLVLLFAAFLMPLSIVYALLLMFVSAHWLPFPMSRVMIGISYYRIPDTLTVMPVVVPVVIFLIGNIVRFLPVNRRLAVAEGMLVAAAVAAIWMGWGYQAKKYDLIAYDYLVRTNQWDAIIARAEHRMPDLPMSVSATNLALGMKDQLGDRVSDFYQHGSQGLLPKFERNFATAQLTGEIYFNLGLVNTAQRFAFEAMEAIPNYNKSARVVKRLAETNLINGQYEVSRKYLQMLSKTIFYRPWALRTMKLLGNEKAIDAHPLYGILRQFRLQDDFLFSEQELDKICGLLFSHNPQNRMAMQYLVMTPLLDGDAQRFLSYVSYVQSKTNYNPRCVREALTKIRRVK